MISFAGDCDPSYALFLQSKILKLKDFVEIKTNPLMFKIQEFAYSKYPQNVQHKRRNVHGEEWGEYEKKQEKKPLYSRTNPKSMCVTRCGVNLWKLSFLMKKSKPPKTSESLIKITLCINMQKKKIKST